MKTVAVLLSVLLAAGVVSGQQGQGFDFAAIQESLLVVPPKMHSQWLKERGFELPGLTEYRKPETTGLRLVGKWGRGRAWEVTGQDSLVFLSLGSQVAILNFADPARPELITELQLDYLAFQARVRDSVLVTGRNGIDLWSIADPARPRHLSHIPCFVSDFDVVDTFLYFVSTDTFNVYSIARPDDPVRLGFCRDSGYVVTATRNTAVLLTRDFLTFIDVSDPSAPRRVGTYGGWPLAAAARGNLLCATFSNPSRPEESWFDAIDIADPASARRLARLNNTCGTDVHLEGPYAFVTGRGGYEPMQILDIADSTRPAVLGELRLPGRSIWSNPTLGRAWVASDWAGLQVVDITNPVTPILDTVLLQADMALDICVDGSRAYVANYRVSLKILDVSDPTRPVELGGADSAGATSEAVVAKDSFAYIGWRPRPYFRVFDVSDPSRPVLAGTSPVESRAMAMVLRDTLVYFAANQWLRIVNVARPREPELVGSCELPGSSGDLWLHDSVAYVSNRGLFFVNVLNPERPRVVGSWPGRVLGVEVVGTTAYCSGVYFFATLDVSDLNRPQVLDSVWLVDNLYDVAVVDTFAYAGGNLLRVFNCADPGQVKQVGTWTPPYSIRRVVYSEPYLYVACWDAGVCILEKTSVGISEREQMALQTDFGILAGPNPVSGTIRLKGMESENGTVCIYDVTGKEVMKKELHELGGRREIDVSGLPAGLYFLDIKSRDYRYVGKFVKP